jgi:D-amino peptidase
MCQGIDALFDAVMFRIPASATNPQGAGSPFPAPVGGRAFENVSMSEGSFNAAIAGHYNVPVIMISGDDAAVAEVKAVIGDVEGAVVKWNYGFHSAKTMTPETACALIREKVTTALGRIKDFKPYKLKTPLQLDVRFKNYRPSEVLGYLSIVERTDAHSIRFVGKDMIEVSKFMGFITTYEPGLEP